MNFYEQLKNDFIIKLHELMPTMGSDMLNTTLKAQDLAAYGYNIAQKNTDIIVADDIPSLLKVYIVVKKTEGLSEFTLQNYWRIIKDFFSWCKKTPEGVTANDIRMYIYCYQTTHNISDRTMDKYRETICWFFTWAHAEGYIESNPARNIKPIRHEIKQREALTQVELEYVRKACQTKRETAMVEFMYSTGCRVSELVDVKKSDINWREKTVHLLGKGRKHRTSFINAKCEVALKEYLDGRDDDCENIFVSERKPHRGQTKAAIEKIVRSISGRCGVNKNITPHVFRHTTATQAVNNGMAIEDVKELLGHANVATTMVYTTISTVKVQSEHARCVI